MATYDLLSRESDPTRTRRSATRSKATTAAAPAITTSSPRCGSRPNGCGARTYPDSVWLKPDTTFIRSAHAFSFTSERSTDSSIVVSGFSLLNRSVRLQPDSQSSRPGACSWRTNVRRQADQARRGSALPHRHGSVHRRYPLPGMLHVAMVRSPYAHARISGIDASAARRASRRARRDHRQGPARRQGRLDSGGLAAAGAQDAAALRDCGRQRAARRRDRRGRRRRDRAAAEDAAALVDVDYDPLSGRRLGSKALPGARRSGSGCTTRRRATSCFRWSIGDKAADRRAVREGGEDRLARRCATPGSCRTRSSRAPRSRSTSRASDEFTLWTHVAEPAHHRLILAAFVLGIPEHKLRVISPDVGGGFGSKIFQYPEEVIVAPRGDGAETAGEVDGAPRGELRERQPRPRSRERDGAGGRRRRQGARPARQDDRERRRLSHALRAGHADVSLRHADERRVPLPRDLLRGDGRLHATPPPSMRCAAPAAPKPPTSSSG